MTCTSNIGAAAAVHQAVDRSMVFISLMHNIYLNMYNIYLIDVQYLFKYVQYLFDSCIIFIASEESFLLSHMGDPKNAIKSLILVVEQFCIEHFLILFQF